MKKHLLAVAFTAAFASTGLYAQTFGSFNDALASYGSSGSFGTLSKQWSYNHGNSSGTNFVTGSSIAGTPLTGQTSEISAFDSKTGTLWVAGGSGVNVFNAQTGALLQNIDTRSFGGINSVAIKNGVAAFAIENSSRSERGIIQFYDTTSRSLLGGNNNIKVGSLPDMLTFTPDGKRLLVANEGTPDFGSGVNEYGAPSASVNAATFEAPKYDPFGSVSIIDMTNRTLNATIGFAGVRQVGSNLRTATGMDFEPEYITVSADGKKAFVGLQEANGMAVLNLETRSFEKIVGLGAKDFGVGNTRIDPLNNSGSAAGNLGVFANQTGVKGLYMPDGMANYQAVGKDGKVQTYIVMANEGDFREDDADRSAASTRIGTGNTLSNLRILNDQVKDSLFATGGRSFSIRDEDGNLIYDSGEILDMMANHLGIYDDGRSRDKGVEPEGVELITINGRVYAFIGLERTLKSAVAIFDITDPTKVSFLDMIVDSEGLAPEGLMAFSMGGQDYLAISNETSRTTAVYSITAIPEPQTYAMMLAGLGVMGAIARRRNRNKQA
jgi:hypothetical protein